jgi:hypothetical protein
MSKYRVLKQVNGHGYTKYIPERRFLFFFWTGCFDGIFYEYDSIISATNVINYHKRNNSKIKYSIVYEE